MRVVVAGLIGLVVFATLGLETPPASAEPRADYTVALAEGNFHTCALRASGTVWCWGDDWRGALGVPDEATPRTQPLEVPGINDVIAVDAGWSYTCALRRDGRVWCWGANQQGQLGDGKQESERHEPAPVSGLTEVIKISAGTSQACAITGGGALYCWGSIHTSSAENLTPQLVPGLTAVDVSVGTTHTCVVEMNGTVKCWGFNTYGEIGNGTNDITHDPAPVTGLINAVQVSAGQWFSCAVNAAGTVRCWGRNHHGQLGNNSTENSNVPVTVQLSGVREVSTGMAHTCVRSGGGRVYCWGMGEYGQVGNNSTEDRLTPAFIGSIDNVLSIRLGMLHSCAMVADGSLRCWGYNEVGMLGDGTLMNRLTPVEVTGLTHVGPSQLAVGDLHTCMRHTGTGIACWGRNASGQLGNDDMTDSSEPVAVEGLELTRSLSAGGFHTCALALNGRVWCWGNNAFRQLGVGDGPSSSVPVQITAFTNAQHLSAGFLHTCAIISGTLRCWGDNSQGQLGNGSTDPASEPVTVSGINNAVSVASGEHHSCALLATGIIQCWGSNASGQLGNSSTTPSSVPVNVNVGSQRFTAIAAGAQHTCGIAQGGSMWCWGRNIEGQLGDLTNTQRTSPVMVSVNGSGGARSLTAGLGHTCAVFDSGSVACWGLNDKGQIGDGTEQNRNAPTFVPEARAVSVAAGGRTTCVVIPGGAITCWGYNEFGQLGDGSEVDSGEPTILQLDSDGDGLLDADEVLVYGTDPFNADTDGDGLTDGEEVLVYGTDPLNPDTSGDGYWDGEKVALGTDPLHYCSIMRADVNHDGTVTIADLSLLAGQFAQTIPPASPRYDQNGDNVITIADLSLQASVFGQTIASCP